MNDLERNPTARAKSEGVAENGGQGTPVVYGPAEGNRSGCSESNHKSEEHTETTLVLQPMPLQEGLPTMRFPMEIHFRIPHMAFVAVMAENTVAVGDLV